MTNKEKKEWLSVKYPLTIIRDRYDGVYSRACWLAFPLDHDEIPEDVNGDDVVCSLFWKTYKEPVGKGGYATDAVIDLIERMEAPEFPEESEDERIRKVIYKILLGLRKEIFTTQDEVVTKDKVLAYLEKQKEQKPVSLTKHVYSKQDKRFIQDCANILIANDYAASAERLLAMFEQKPAEWSEEDVKRLYSIGTEIGFLKGKYSEWQKDIDWLYALAEKMGFHKCKTGEVVIEWKKEDIDDKMLFKPKQEWSEEDEDFINMLILHFNYLIDKGGDSVETYKSYREKLKSLRPSWKPSEEQMEALEYVISDYREDGCNATANYLQEILDHLKNM